MQVRAPVIASPRASRRRDPRSPPTPPERSNCRGKSSLQSLRERCSAVFVGAIRAGGLKGERTAVRRPGRSCRLLRRLVLLVWASTEAIEVFHPGAGWQPSSPRCLFAARLLRDGAQLARVLHISVQVLSRDAAFVVEEVHGRPSRCELKSRCRFVRGVRSNADLTLSNERCDGPDFRTSYA
jgi:hypothetical protein